MPVLPSPPVETQCKVRLQPLPAGDEIAQRSLERQMEVVSHDHKRVQQPLAAFACLEQARLERGAGGDLTKNPRAIVAAIDDMVNRTGKFESEFSRHGCQPGPHEPAAQTAIYPISGIGCA